ncbi:DUF5908 family protein [Pedobacter sandarakinus]|uniref:DUF5908 family protein n=1 Tax=Pedobacter sandarakinus TaxID=353156 RepID=UPI0022453172|nr:DUF5908 family protein [Pedobacter sandarakinus]MCX2574542.1 DUF5908 family protein [Pedobacter sandarakinus]
MPVEIKELNITATIVNSSNTGNNANGNSGGALNKQTFKKALAELKQQIKNKNER